MAAGVIEQDCGLLRQRLESDIGEFGAGEVRIARGEVGSLSELYNSAAHGVDPIDGGVVESEPGG